jgi:hypothetical protein
VPAGIGANASVTRSPCHVRWARSGHTCHQSRSHAASSRGVSMLPRWDGTWHLFVQPSIGQSEIHSHACTPTSLSKGMYNSNLVSCVQHVGSRTLWKHANWGSTESCLCGTTVRLQESRVHESCMFPSGMNKYRRCTSRTADCSSSVKTHSGRADEAG